MRFRTIATAAVLAAAALAASGGAAMAATTTQAVKPTTPVPAAVQVPPGQVLIADFLAHGVQIYRCTGGTWTFVEPAAHLFGWTKRPGNLSTAIHFRGPSWESTDDGSLVEARAIASSPVPGSIPQLLLQATRNGGDGVFTYVTYLQRLATKGGAAPTGDCVENTTAAVKYQAQYRFFRSA